jgi:serine/threonine protein kinase
MMSPQPNPATALSKPLAMVPPSAARWKKVNELFSSAIDLPAAEREAFLHSHGADRETIAEVRRLIRLESESGDFLNQPVDASEPARPGLEEGQILSGRYRVERRIGAGGMSGGVYAALDLRHGVMVALKNIADSREFQLARRITHPNVCRVFDCDSDGDIQFLTMELLRGQTLEERLQERGALVGHELDALVRQLCAGLKAAHDAGVLHRDLKPANVLLTEGGRVVIADFGLARQTCNSHSQQLAGTLNYMAPELLAGRPASVASDLYALGVLLHQAATGELPIDPAPLPSTLKRAIRCCLQMDPAMRPESVDSLTKILQSFENRVRGILRIWPQKTSPACLTSARLASPQPGRTSTPVFTTLSGLLS